MNKEELQSLVGKYLNGYKIVKVEKDPFIKGQINLFTDTWRTAAFNDRCLIKFVIREEPNTAKIYQELTDKENFNLKQALSEIKEDIEFCINGMKNEYACTDERTNRELHTMVKILNESVQTIDKALGGNNEKTN